MGADRDPKTFPRRSAKWMHQTEKRKTKKKSKKGKVLSAKGESSHGNKDYSTKKREKLLGKVAPRHEGKGTHGVLMRRD